MSTKVRLYAWCSMSGHDVNAKNIWKYMVKFTPIHAKPPEWKELKRWVRKGLKMADRDWLYLADWLGGLAKKQEELQTASRFTRWHSRAVKQGDTVGSALLHKYIKGPFLGHSSR